jgi:thymidylate synthase
MSEGFPLLTTKRVAWKTMKVELEGFIKGITSKKWFQDRGCKIWNEWCSPQKIPYSTDHIVQKLMADEDDLGPCLYGASWRGFHDPMAMVSDNPYGPGLGGAESESHNGQKVDQFADMIKTLKANPQDRRMIVLAWNPLGLKHTALPACHVLFQVTTRGNKLDLTWYQRSCDVFLGIPFNLASYALLLHLIAKEVNMEEGVITGFLADVHLYENHIDQANEQLSREVYDLPNVTTGEFTSIFDWTSEDTDIHDYKYHPAIKASVAI